MSPSLQQLRQQIDRIDLRLLQLLNARAKLVLRVGGIKRRQRQPVFDPKREARVLRQMVQAGRGPLPVVSIREIFRHILRQSRKLERSAKR
jgi:chorismate mutase/prephenate dehydratase